MPRSIRACDTTGGGKKKSFRSSRVRPQPVYCLPRCKAPPRQSLRLTTTSTADGAFTLLTFQHTPPLPLMTTTSARLAAALLLPFSLTSSHTLGPIGGALSLNLTARTALTNLVIRIPLASPIEAPGQVQVTVSGGALLRDDEGRSIGGGAGRWEVIDEEVEEHAGELGAKRKTRYVLVWRIDKLSPSDRPAVLTGQYNTCVGARSLPGPPQPARESDCESAIAQPRRSAKTARLHPHFRQPLGRLLRPSSRFAQTARRDVQRVQRGQDRREGYGRDPDVEQLRNWRPRLSPALAQSRLHGVGVSQSFAVRGKEHARYGATTSHTCR